MSTLSIVVDQQIQELVESQPNDLSEQTVTDFSAKVSTLLESWNSVSAFTSFKESAL